MQQHDAYQAAFGHLLRDLKVDDYMPSGLTVPMVALFFMFGQIICTFFVLSSVS